jgi:tRNA(Ile)-lysidine synthase
VNDRILLAVSGGLDSMVMLNLFVRGGFTVGVAHSNFQLRGDESEKDENFVKATCARLSIPFFTTKFATQAYAQQHSVSIQMAARELRYAWFATMAELHNFQHIATAHHANDSLETVLFNWANGTGTNGLGGIAIQQGIIIRPLLWATRNDIEKYASENSIAWREDVSNSTDDYTRNFIRHQIVPKLKELNPSLETTFLRGQRKLQGELAFLQQAIEDWKMKFVKQSNFGFSIDKKALSDLVNGAAILHHVISSYGFNFDVCEEIFSALNGQSGKKFISTQHLLIIDREKLLVTRHQQPEQEVVIENENTEYTLGALTITLKNSINLTLSSSPLVAVIDADTLHYPLRWRTWREGDAFCPLGMKHKKKLSDFLIDSKISVSEKANVTVLESSGQIIWVVGYRIDNRFKVTAQTKRTLIVSLSTIF